MMIPQFIAPKLRGKALSHLSRWGYWMFVSLMIPAPFLQAQVSASGGPTLVSASSVDGRTIGLCFSTPMNTTGLTKPASYQLVAQPGSSTISGVSQWEGGTSVVLRLSKQISGTFTIAAKDLSDLDGNPISSASVTGHVWAPNLASKSLGNLGLASQYFSCADGHVVVRAEGEVFGGIPSDFGVLYENRTNDFDIQVRIDSLTKPTDPDSTGLLNPYLAGAGLVAFDPNDPKGFTIDLFALPSNGSRLFMLAGIISTGNANPPNEIDATWADSAPEFPIWLRIRRAGSTFRFYYSTNSRDWIPSRTPSVLDAPARMQVGIFTFSESKGIYATAEYSEYGDTPLNPSTTIEFAQNPADISVEENHPAMFSTEVSVVGANPEDVIYQWQIESAAGSGQYKDIPLASDSKYLLARPKASDSGLHLRVLARVSGAPTFVSRAALLTVTPDQTAPQVRSVVWRSAWNDIVVTFSEAVDRTLANRIGNYAGIGFSIQSATLDASGRRVSLTPTDPLDLSTTPRLVVSSITDLAGNVLPGKLDGFPVAQAELQRGAALQELYMNIPAEQLIRLTSSSRYPGHPDSRSLVSSLEGPFDIADNYGTRISGFLIPPVTGNYHFWMCSDDQSQFWLSTDSTPDNLVMLCEETAWNPARLFNTLVRRNASAPQNRSSSLFPDGIPLEAGKPYYFEALSKEGGGDDNLAVAWQIPGGQAPVEGGEPISGAYLAVRNYPTDATIEIRRQPSLAQAETFAVNAAAPQPLLTEEFDTSDGGFTMAQSGNPGGAWEHHPESGYWSAHGNDDLPISEKLLTSPTIVVGVDGEVRLRFTHQYTFEEGMIDGGQIRVRVNDGTFTSVPASAFSENGYTGIIAGSGNLFMIPGFGNTSEGYDAGDWIVSDCTLGIYRAGDRLQIQFRGLWDYSYAKPGLGWVIDRVELTQGNPGMSEATFFVEATASRADGVIAPLSYVWQKDCGAGFEDIPGANAAIYRFRPSSTDTGCRFRCQLFTPGATATTAEASLLLASPALRVEHTKNSTVLWWSGATVLETAPALTGPWSKIDKASNPYPLSILGASQFYRAKASE